MQTRKIALACAAGGACGALVALWLSPSFWWLGLVAGFMVGYLSYEFRATLRAIPIAFHAAHAGGGEAWRYMTTSTRTFFSKRHPFIYGGLVFGIPAGVWSLLSPHTLNDLSETGALIVWWIIALETTVLVALLFTAVFGVCAAFGAHFGERCFWTEAFWVPLSEEPEYLKQGFTEQPLTYANAARWTAKGVWLIVIFFVWTMWKYLFIAAWAVLCFGGRFLRAFMYEIRSDERLACGLFAALGAAAGYLLFLVMPDRTFTTVVCVAGGALFGAFFGVVGHKTLAALLPPVPVSVKDKI